MTGIKLEGMRELENRLASADTRVLAAVRKQLFKDATLVMNESRALAPFDTGALAGSAALAMGGSIKSPEAQITYGGPSAPYALAQHENVDFYHPSKKRGGTSAPSTSESSRERGAKYLTRPLFRLWPKIQNNLAAVLERSI